MKINKIVLSLATAAALVSGVGSSLAATTTTSINVRATVAATCIVSNTTDVDFNIIVTGALTQYDAAGNVQWRCTTGTSPVLSISSGGSSDIADREMTGVLNSDKLSYQLYTSAARTTIFGDGSTGDTVPGAGAGMATPVTTDIFGRILDSDVASVSADDYSDVVSVTLTF